MKPGEAHRRTRSRSGTRPGRRRRRRRRAARCPARRRRRRDLCGGLSRTNWVRGWDERMETKELLQLSFSAPFGRLRGLQGLGLQARRPLPNRGRGRVRTEIPTAEQLTARDYPQVIELIVAVREDLAQRGLDARPETIGWHLQHSHHVTVSRPPSPAPGRAGPGHPRAEQTPEVVLPPLGSRAAQRMLASRPPSWTEHPGVAGVRGRNPDRRRPCPPEAR
jgi:hypothetical protein